MDMDLGCKGMCLESILQGTVKGMRPPFKASFSRPLFGSTLVSVGAEEQFCEVSSGFSSGSAADPGEGGRSDDRQGL